MTCPICTTKYEYGNLCPHCRADAKLYKSVAQMSDALYNGGLAKIKNSDLSGAIELLNKSISVNKRNTQARNLLGLVQYEIGHIGEALKNWVISCGLQREDNEAENYINKIQNNARALESLNDAIRIYNLSIKDIRQNSNDMAIIKLRQAVDINPKFLDALNLLALCYMMQKDRSKAATIVDRVLAIDANNATATKYYNELNPGTKIAGVKIGKAQNSKSKKKAAKEEPVTPYKQVTLHERRNVNFHIEGILCLVIGAVLAVAVMTVFINPAMEPTDNFLADQLQIQLAAAEENYSQLAAEKDQEIAALIAEQSELIADAEYWEERHFNLERTLQVLGALELLREGNLADAANALAAINTEGLTQEAQGWAAEIRSTAFPQLAQEYFSTGFTLYFAGDFTEALTNFQRSYEFAQHLEDGTLFSDVLYYLGWTFSQGINNAQSIHYFERLLNEFPDHRYTNDAINRLNHVLEQEAQNAE